MAFAPIEAAILGSPHPNGRAAFLDMLEHLAATVSREPFLCVALDLGDLRRSDRVARTLGPVYADGLVAAAEQRIRQAVGPEIDVLQVDTDCFAFAVSDDGGTGWQALVQHVVDSLQQPLDNAGLPGAIAPCAGLVRCRAGEIDVQDVLRGAIAAAQDARAADTAWRLDDGGAVRDYRRLHALLAGLAP